MAVYNGGGWDITLKVLDPIDPSTYGADPAVLAQRVRALMAEELLAIQVGRRRLVGGGVGGFASAHLGAAVLGDAFVELVCVCDVCEHAGDRKGVGGGALALMHVAWRC